MCTDISSDYQQAVASGKDKETLKLVMYKSFSAQFIQSIPVDPLATRQLLHMYGLYIATKLAS